MLFVFRIHMRRKSRAMPMSVFVMSSGAGQWVFKQGHGRRTSLERRGVVLCPVAGKRRCAQELLVRVLFVDVYRLEVGLDESFAEECGARDELRFGKVGVEDKGIVLREISRDADSCGCRLTQSPPSIFLARNMPTAAIILGLHLKKRWSKRVTSIKNLDNVLVWIS